MCVSICACIYKYICSSVRSWESGTSFISVSMTDDLDWTNPAEKEP